jgi:hypothetical protein
MPVCQPVNPCPCHPWAIAPGDTQPLFVDWSAWLASTPGWSLHSVVHARLLDLSTSPPVPADPAEMALVSGLEPPPPQGAPGRTSIVGTATENIVRAGADVAVGRAYRLNLSVAARDCNGRKITASDSVYINTALA